MAQVEVPFSKQTDEQLAVLCKDENQKAFDELTRRHLKAIYNFALQYARNTDDASDIAQDTFFKTWKYFKRYEPSKRFLPWLYTIARNTALDYIKKKRASSFSEMDRPDDDFIFSETIENKEPSAGEIFDLKIASADLIESLNSLNPDHVTILRLRYHEELTFEEIGEVMNKPMNTVKSLHRRSLIKLKSLLSHHLSE